MGVWELTTALTTAFPRSIRCPEELKEHQSPKARSAHDKAIHAGHLKNTAANDTIGATDSVELSDTAALQSAARDLPDIREDRIAQARARIAAGEYDSEKRAPRHCRPHPRPVRH